MSPTLETVHYVIFTSNYTRVAIGKCTRSGAYKFFGGRVEEIDRVKGDENGSQTAHNCGGREVKEEFDVTDEDFSLVEDKPVWSRYIESRHSIHNFYLAVLKEGKESVIPDAKSEEMINPDFYPVDQLLSSVVTSGNFRFNPIHAIALTRAVQSISSQPRCDYTKEFFLMYDGLLQNRVHLDSHEQMIYDMMSQGVI